MERKRTRDEQEPLESKEEKARRLELRELLEEAIFGGGIMDQGVKLWVRSLMDTELQDLIPLLIALKGQLTDPPQIIRWFGCVGEIHARMYDEEEIGELEMAQLEILKSHINALFKKKNLELADIPSLNVIASGIEAHPDSVQPGDNGDWGNILCQIMEHVGSFLQTASGSPGLKKAVDFLIEQTVSTFDSSDWPRIGKHILELILQRKHYSLTDSTCIELMRIVFDAEEVSDLKDAIFRDFVLPCLAISDADMNLIRDKPVSYERRIMDSDSDFSSLQCEVIQFLEEIDSETPFGKACFQEMESILKKSDEHMSEKTAVLRVLAKAEIPPESRESFDHILNEYLIPLLSSKEHYIKAELCGVILNRYGMRRTGDIIPKDFIQFLRLCLDDDNIVVCNRALMAVGNLYPQLDVDLESFYPKYVTACVSVVEKMMSTSTAEALFDFLRSCPHIVSRDPIFILQKMVDIWSIGNEDMPNTLLGSNENLPLMDNIALFVTEISRNFIRSPKFPAIVEIIGKIYDPEMGTLGTSLSPIPENFRKLPPHPEGSFYFTRIVSNLIANDFENFVKNQLKELSERILLRMRDPNDEFSMRRMNVCIFGILFQCSSIYRFKMEISRETPTDFQLETFHYLDSILPVYLEYIASRKLRRDGFRGILAGMLWDPLTTLNAIRTSKFLRVFIETLPKFLKNCLANNLQEKLPIFALLSVMKLPPSEIPRQFRGKFELECLSLILEILEKTQIYLETDPPSQPKISRGSSLVEKVDWKIPDKDSPVKQKTRSWRTLMQPGDPQIQDENPGIQLENADWFSDDEDGDFSDFSDEEEGPMRFEQEKNFGWSVSILWTGRSIESDCESMDKHS
eukprot:TRINITY_DN7831_c0_g1_i5.p1 TRINITY_DN7831_c0_g1~~TRINITY_DN7831_c0_g1_i5.p1  ORF type:complete len:857 (+),score=238.72 TRINITY_DN7831_c0_g1_i5:3-2573(+)